MDGARRSGHGALGGLCLVRPHKTGRRRHLPTVSEDRVVRNAHVKTLTVFRLGGTLLSISPDA